MGQKAKTQKGKAAGQYTEQQVLNNSLKTFKEVCHKIAGPETFKQLSPISVSRIISNRYPALRMRATDQIQIPPARTKHLNEIFKNMLNNETCTSPRGETMSLSTFHREGLMLIHYLTLVEGENQTLGSALREIQQNYHQHSEYYLKPIQDLIHILWKFSIIMTDWNERLFTYNINETCGMRGLDGNNEILISAEKPKAKTLKLESHPRELVQVGWTNFEGKITQLRIKPKWIGFREDPKSNDYCEVYIQKHALLRLQERIGLVPGLMHEAVYETLRKKEKTWHKRSDKRIVEYKIIDKKVGYLVCSFDEGVIIIRSFLFLTNTGTPEGNKLSELTSLEPMDKKYLKIDTLLGLAGYNIAHEPRLKELFTNAGCQDLLDLADLTKFSKSSVHEQDTESLLKYLSPNLRDFYENTAEERPLGLAEDVSISTIHAPVKHILSPYKQLI
ncbi:hypothetical protein [Pedobacter sp. GR22-6]|uniref:hypothetical protein n=1 Tax=Pedobacter sp. GR22-6 TaxID=3127957 RepID=UPI00307D7FBC